MGEGVGGGVNGGGENEWERRCRNEWVGKAEGKG